MQLISWKSGWKTYATCAVAIGAAAYNQVEGHAWPGWVDMLLGFAGVGGGSLRHAIQTQTATVIKNAMQTAALAESLGKLLQANLTVPTLGKPSPAGMTPQEEEAETRALNAAQAAKS